MALTGDSLLILSSPLGRMTCNSSGNHVIGNPEYRTPCLHLPPGGSQSLRSILPSRDSDVFGSELRLARREC
jgi:hypothetical protein